MIVWCLVSDDFQEGDGGMSADVMTDISKLKNKFLGGKGKDKA
jgi:hypothetical protein